MTSAQYHADPCPEPSLNATVAKALVLESPLHAWAKHPRLGGRTGPPTPAMIDGSIRHALMAGEVHKIVVINWPDYRTAAARELRDEATRHDMLPILAHRLDEIRAEVERVRSRLATCGLRGYFEGGRHEHVLTWQEDTPHGRIWCRAMVDWVSATDEDGQTCRVADLKNRSGDMSFRSLRQAVEYDGHYIQAVHYLRGLQVCGLRPESFTFVFAETGEPFDVVPITLDANWLEIGRRRWARAVNTFAKCLQTGVWPGRTDRPLEAYPPQYLIDQELLTGATEV